VGQWAGPGAFVSSRVPGKSPAGIQLHGRASGRVCACRPGTGSGNS
jgi:hypothetical protein